MRNKLFIAQFNSENGGNESVVLFDHYPTEQEQLEYSLSHIKCEAVYQLEQVDGPMLCDLPLERTLAEIPLFS